ncbi:hypothetical protein BCR35DRAFT_302083 [Leucosporidium creatinivorum]|uniref:Macrofage activating glycoprotein n=1 Tax=Leucosporidium creatinivorum TaxID=106004 RepID=A0A1Y2FVW4_9BASI|nr:hypothetical protein BCR35DRAFT_302083 [Leucosporidium creatinivorum]
MKSSLALLVAGLAAFASAGNVVIDPNNPPAKTEDGQYGWNNCYKHGRDSKSANCQSLWIGSAEDFCIFAPHAKSTVGSAERDVVAWCTKAGHGARLIPKGTFTGVHFIRTPHYIQITAVGDFTKINVAAKDEGGELDPHGADGYGNPVGGIVIAQNGAKRVQIQEWSQFLAYNELSIRACLPGSDAARWCPHVYDVMGSEWNHPGNYKKGTFDSCTAKDVSYPPGVYKKNGKLSTWYQGVNPTPAAHAPAASSKCTSYKTIGGTAKYPV